MENQLGTQKLAQIGMLVNDIEATANAYGALLGQEVRITESKEEEKEETRYMALRTAAGYKEAVFSLGEGVELRVLEPDRSPSVWRDALEKKGEGIHYLGFVVDDIEKRTESFEQQGYSQLQAGGWDGGRYVYMEDGSDAMKTMLVMLEKGK